LKCFEVNDSEHPITMSDALDSLLAIVAERNFDFYECIDGRIVKT
jgi:hypothetical protein